MDHALTVKVIECISTKKEWNDVLQCLSWLLKYAKIKNNYTDLDVYTVDNIYNKKRQI
jgi:hypothetical protein